MSTSAIDGFSNPLLQQAQISALRSARIGQSSSVTGATASAASQSDSSQLSPAAQLAGTLQQLQQSDPAKFAQVTAEIAKNLTSAAQTAQSQGNTSAATRLNQLAGDFSTASKTGQLPDLQNLSQAVSGGGHHRHHHAESAAGASADSSSTSSADNNPSSEALKQLLAALRASGNQSAQNLENSAFNAGAIILQTLSDAGVNGSKASVSAANG